MSNISGMSSTASNIPVSPAAGEAGGQIPAAPVKKQSYGQILKSSAIIGGSSAINIVSGIVRTKAMAVLLGPGGVGLMGLYSSIADLARSITGMGINSSGVRQIAEAVATGEQERIARTAAVLRRASLLLGIFGALLLVVFCREVSTMTFGTDRYALATALLALVVLFRTVSDGQGALLQGTRRIADLAKSGVIAAVLGTVAAILLVYFLRENGVVPSLVAGALISLVFSWWYSRKTEIKSPRMTVGEMWREAGALFKLGFAFMASALLTMGCAYVVRMIVLKNDGMGAAGLYQAAWVLGGLYVGFILQAMGSDFYPRLTGVANDHGECNRLVNEQAEVGLLLAGPGMIATLTFAPLVLAAFYTSEFAAAAQPLRWICLGLALRVVAWPMGFIVLAKGAQKTFFWTEVAATAVHVGLAFVAVDFFGVSGAGMAFFGLYLWHSVLIYFIVRRLTGFRWSPACNRVNVTILSTLGIVFAAFYVLPPLVATVFGSVMTVLCAFYSMHMLCRLVPLHRLPRTVQRLLVLLRFAPASNLSTETPK